MPNQIQSASSALLFCSVLLALGVGCGPGPSADAGPSLDAGPDGDAGAVGDAGLDDGGARHPDFPPFDHLPGSCEAITTPMALDTEAQRDAVATLLLDLDPGFLERSLGVPDLRDAFPGCSSSSPRFEVDAAEGCVAENGAYVEGSLFYESGLLQPSRPVDLGADEFSAQLAADHGGEVVQLDGQLHRENTNYVGNPPFSAAVELYWRLGETAPAHFLRFDKGAGEEGTGYLLILGGEQPGEVCFSAFYEGSILSRIELHR